MKKEKEKFKKKCRKKPLLTNKTKNFNPICKLVSEFYWQCRI